MVGPELRQYIVANDKEEMPFNRCERSWIYATAKKQQNTFDDLNKIFNYNKTPVDYKSMENLFNNC